MERWRGKFAVVTGAASGIGEAITDSLLEKGVNVIGLDIQEDKLDAMKQTNREGRTTGILYPTVCDFNSADNVDRTLAWITDTFDKVHILVNNAGVANYTRVIESDRKAFEKLLNINILAVATCTNWAVRRMRDQNVEGHVFIVNSVLGHEIPMGSISETEGCNGWNIYPACKHATVALTHTVRRELAAVQAKIRITSISPGLVKTNITKRTPNLEGFFDTVQALRPEDVADAVIYALGTRPEVQITELVIQHTNEM